MATTRRDDWGVGKMDIPNAQPQHVASPALLPIIDAFKANLERIDGIGSSLALSIGLPSLSVPNTKPTMGLRGTSMRYPQRNSLKITYPKPHCISAPPLKCALMQ